jgi:membrane fusion protein (multidrug efflux system)
VETAELTARQAEADAAAAKASADRAQADFERAHGLLQQQIIAQAEFDTAKAAAISSEAAYKSAREKVATETSRVKEARAQLEAAKSALDQALAQVQQAKADLQIAELNLSYTKILAPADGRVTRKNVEPGAYVQVGQPLLALVEPELWAVANFKETQLAQIRRGQPVEIEIDSVPGRHFQGRVDSIQAGSGARFSLLPPENAVGNYVKVVQRVPVKIVFNGEIRADHILGPGMSVVPSVVVSNFQLPAWVRILAAAALSAILVWLVMRMIAARARPEANAPTG